MKSMTPVGDQLLALRARMLDSKKPGNSLFTKKWVDHDWYQVACGLTILEKMDDFDTFIIGKCITAYDALHANDKFKHNPSKNTAELIKRLITGTDKNLKIASVEAYLQDKANASSKLYEILLEKIKKLSRDSKPVETVKPIDVCVIEAESNESKAIKKIDDLHVSLLAIIRKIYKYSDEDNYHPDRIVEDVLNCIYTELQKSREAIKSLKSSIVTTPKSYTHLDFLLIKNGCLDICDARENDLATINKLQQVLMMYLDKLHSEKGSLQDRAELNETVREYVLALEEYKKLIKTLEKVFSEMLQAMQQGKLKEFIKEQKNNPHAFFSKMPTQTEAFDHFDKTIDEGAFTCSRWR